jgi:NAD+ kinase
MKAADLPHEACAPHDADVLGVDVVVIQKQTALERYTRRTLNVDFLEYVEQGGGSLAHLRDAHEDHVAARHVVQKTLAKRGLSFLLWNLDELSEKAMSPYKPAGLRGVEPSAGLVPRRKLVVSLGGDGTLLHASHFVGGDVTLLGVNSCPPHSVGALCAATADTFPEVLDAVLSGTAPLVNTRRLLVTTSERHALPLALNDLLLCNQHPAATSRYQISVTVNLDEEATSTPGTSVPLRTETQLSSGLWVAAPAGSSAVIQGYGLPPLPLQSSSFSLAVREPYVGLEELRIARRQGQAGYALDRLTLDGDTESLTLLCRMRTGLVCVDGPDNGVRLGFGARVNISLPAAGAVRLVPRRALPSFDNLNKPVP